MFLNTTNGHIEYNFTFNDIAYFKTQLDCKGQYIINEIVFYNYLKLYTLNIYTKNKEIYITLDIYIKKVYILFIYTNINHIYSLLTIFQHKKKYPPALVSCFPHAFQLYYFRYIVIPTTNPVSTQYRVEGGNTFLVIRSF